MLDHAIVMGGSVAGLLAAAGLAPHCGRVTIVDRDQLPTDGPAAFAARRGVPQGGTVHRLLALGEARMGQLLPGLREELLAAGAALRAEHEPEAPDEAVPDADGSSPLRPGIDEPGTLWLTRPLLEGVLRRRVLALPGVEARQGAVDFDADLARRFAGPRGWPVIPTQAGHDAGILQAAGIPTAMLFVRNPTGVSHSPAERAETADCLAGVEALADVLGDLSGAA